MSNEPNLIDEPLEATPCAGGFTVTGPRGMVATITPAALRESARRFSEALEERGPGLPLRDHD